MERNSPQPNLATGRTFSLAFWTICVTTGIGAGLGAIALMALLRAVQHLAWHYASGTFQHAVENAPYDRRIAVMAVAGVVASAGALAVRALGRGEPSCGLTSAIWYESGRLPPLRSFASGALSMTLVALGVSLGRETAPKAYGAAVASALCGRFGTSPAERRLLVACGAGAGMAAVYNVPLGGALFGIEVLLGSLSLPLVIPAIVCSFVATAIAWTTLGDRPTYAVAAIAPSLSTIVWAIAFGPLAGLAAVALVRGVAWGRATKPAGAAAWLLPIGAFTALGAVACAYPQILGNGKDVAQQAFSNGIGLELLAILAAAKLAATVASLRTGAPGGLFTPTVAFGALVGGALGHVWALAWPGGSPAAYALVGAAAILAASTKGPVSAIVLMLELTGSLDGLMIPMLIATAGATLVAERLDPRSSYSVDVPVPAIVGDPVAGPYVVTTATRATNALQRLVRAGTPRLLVVDEHGALAGAFAATALDRVRRHVPFETTTASDLLQPLDATTGPPEPVLDASRRVVGVSGVARAATA